MNTNQIFEKLAKRCGDKFLGVFARDKLPPMLPPRRPLMLICNTDPQYESGEHWIAMYFGEDAKGEYFDSFGEDVPLIFKKYLDKFCSSWITNERQLQSVLSSVCGQYCVFYCLFKYLRYDMDSISRCFTNDTALNDFIVHQFVCFNL